jgi:hypothetical protein
VYYLERNAHLCGLVVRVPGYRSRGTEFDSWRYQEGEKEGEKESCETRERKNKNNNNLPKKEKSKRKERVTKKIKCK